MAIELFWGSGSPFAWRVLLTLEAKKLSYDSKLLEFSRGDHKSAEFLKLNPRGKVPCLRDGDFVLYESIAMMAYLDRQYPDPPLFGKSAEETGLIWRAISECEYLISAGDKVIRPIFFGKGLDKLDEIQEAAQKIRDELKRLDEQLARSSWLVGNAMSAADIAVFPLVQLCLRAAVKDAARPFNLQVAPLSDHYSNVAKWVRQIETLAYYERTYPPHWRQ